MGSVCQRSVRSGFSPVRLTWISLSSSTRQSSHAREDTRTFLCSRQNPLPRPVHTAALACSLPSEITKHPTPPAFLLVERNNPLLLLKSMARKNAQVITSSYATNDDPFPSSSASSSSAGSVTSSPNSPPAPPPVSNKDMQASSVLQAPIQSTLDMTEQGYSEKSTPKDEQSAGGGANELHRRTAGTSGGEERKRRMSMPARTMSKNPRVFEGSQGLLSKVILSGRDRRSFLLLILLCESWLCLLRSWRSKSKGGAVD